MVSRGDPRPAAVVTGMRLAAPVDRVWQGLMLYEQIPGRPSLLLRLLLPAPLGASGRRSAVGDEVRCAYAGGSLLKRATRVEPNRRYWFEIVEQQVSIGGGIRLLGGGYTLRETPGGTWIELETRYQSPRRPGWLWRPIESAVCRAFHRHILGGMRGAVEGPPGLRGGAPWNRPRANADPIGR